MSFQFLFLLCTNKQKANITIVCSSRPKSTTSFPLSFPSFLLPLLIVTFILVASPP
ncbi:unnamed protein product [Penicillium salamii]|nr:unnamed protein product [Penicillium salamii]CAG8319344.1 unnamed protein product [Penicillium salamii]